MRLTKTSWFIIIALALGLGIGSVRLFAPNLWASIAPRRQVAESVVPKKADLPAVADPSHPSTFGSAPVGGDFPQLSSYDLAPGCAQLPEVRLDLWAWNAHMGFLRAVGGTRSAKGSLMCKHGVNLKLTRQDMADQMQNDLYAFADAYARGNPNPSEGHHFVTIMGDGAAAFLAALNSRLEKLGPEYRAVVVGSFGYSRGEDKFMAPPEVKADPQRARGLTIAGYLRDGDWNIAMKWAADNGICNNPDDRTYDPNCLNWLNTSDYIDAAQKYVAGYCEDRPVKGTRETRNVCVNGVVTWTPGDVIVAKKKGGLVSIASTREYYWQMPNAVIGIRKWAREHRVLVEGMLEAAFEGARLVRSSDAELRRAAAISALVYNDKDAEAQTPQYWYKYYHGVTERDAQGLMVELGGSAVNDLADNCFLFGLQSCALGSSNLFKATYEVFGDIVVQQYPDLVPNYPSTERILDTSFIEAIAARSGTIAAPEVPRFEATKPVTAVVSSRSFQINFDSGRATFRPDAHAVLADVERQALVAGGLAIEIHGHTDSQGNPQANRILSQERALAVKRWLQGRSAANFSDARVRPFGHGDESPLDTNTTPAGRAKNRRVEIVLGSTN